MRTLTRRALLHAAAVTSGATLFAACGVRRTAGTPVPAAVMSPTARVTAAGEASAVVETPAIPGLAVFPLPNSATAMPQTEITIRGVTPDAIAAVSVTGSQSGGHLGTLVPHSDNAGASFVPSSPFTPGEHVSVAIEVAGQPRSFQFTVATPVAVQPAGPGQLVDDPQYVWHFRSRPDLLPPRVTVTRTGNTAPGLIFLGVKGGDGVQGYGQRGAMVLDEQGELVGFFPVSGDDQFIENVSIQTYQGKPVLAWWEGQHVVGYGRGRYVLRDTAYRPIVEISAGNGYAGDFHEFQITPQNTALFVIYQPVQWDLSAAGGSAQGIAVDGVIQELDIVTGRVLFEWHALDHVSFDESYVAAPQDPNNHYDFFHINAVDIDLSDNTLLVSARYTWSIYKIDRKTGAVIWRLGGKRSSFTLGQGVQTAYQHHIRWHRDGTLTIFDNGGANNDTKVHDQSRGIVLKLDTGRKQVSLVRQYTHPDKVFSESQGSMQVLDNGNVLIGWGSAPYFSEHRADGTLVLDGRLPDQNASYRAFRSIWNAQPADPPVLAVERGEGDAVTVYASWNGATTVARWQVVAGPSPEELSPVSEAPKQGFETAITAHTAQPWIAVRALDAKGQVLAQSAVVAAPPVGGS